jgi:putative Mn2+ efflux pump MntP
MDLGSVLLIAVGLSMDAFAVAVTYGLSFKRREHRAALEIALAFGAFQALMPLLGWLAGLGLRTWIESFDHWIALAVLAFIGGKMVFDAIAGGEEPSLAARGDAPGGSGVLNRWTLLGLAVATSIDALAVGLALSLLGVSLVLPVVTIGCVTFAISYGGIVLGYEFTAWLRERGRRIIQAVGGLILVAIGVRILVEHLIGRA